MGQHRGRWRAMNDLVLATVEKNSREIIRVERSNFKGHDLISIRVWAERRDGSVVPTRKGISCNVALLPKIIDALQRALEPAQQTGAKESTVE
jgi:hypothetical protein